MTDKTHDEDYTTFSFRATLTAILAVVFYMYVHLVHAFIWLEWVWPLTNPESRLAFLLSANVAFLFVLVTTKKKKKGDVE